MTNQVLRSRTIIPSELYVERSADRQLRQILEDMGRPGYVLVARQMGKTNLLLNAKRERNGSRDSFCYIDVSNIIPDLRAFFRSLVDACIDAYPERFQTARDRIAGARERGSLLPHKEHEAELRELLRNFEGKLILCLDEIDALTKTEYSDQVFSLIRSIYFSGRTNFPEFERLTYVLSGVAEPSEIIKNKAISPFNIGEKIYLNDFSAREFGIFLEKANLSLGSDVRDRVYHWTAGNPRMTWDLCAAAENAGADISVEVVDALVDRLYLESFDVPPVDHIRALAEVDKDIRQALIAIHYGKGSSISDAVRSRLYLAGITSGAGSEVAFKNKIIELALSERWLSDLESQTNSKRDRARTLFVERKYAEALALYEEVESESEGSETDAFLGFYKGSCQYYLGKYAAAIDTLGRNPISRATSVDFYTDRVILIASSHFLLDHLSECISLLEKLFEEFDLDGGEHPLSFYQAAIVLSTAYLRSSPTNIERVRTLCKSVIEASAVIPRKDSNAEVLQKFTYAANFNLYLASSLSHRLDEALVSLNEAIQASNAVVTPTLLLERAQKFESGKDRLATLRKAARHCVDSQVVAVAASALERPLALTSDVAARLIEALAYSEGEQTGSTAELLAHFADTSMGHQGSVHEIVSKATNYAFQYGHPSVAVRLFGMGSKLPAGSGVADEDRRYLIAVALLLAASQDEVAELGEIYIREAVGKAGVLAPYDLRSVYVLVRHLITRGRPEDARVVLDWARANANFESEDLDLSLTALAFDYLDLAVSRSTDSTYPVAESAVRLSRSVAACKGPNPSYFPEAFKAQLLKHVYGLAPKAFVPTTVQRTERKIGRNEVVRVKLEDGTVVTGKYKKLEADISSGRAVLLAAEPTS